MRFRLVAAGLVRGDQLVDEIKQATGLDLAGRYRFLPPDAVVIDRDDAVLDAEADVLAAKDQIAAIVAAHVPDPLYFPEDRERAVVAEIDAKATEARALWDGYEALRDKTPAEIEALVRARINGWSTLTAAKADLAEWLPRMAALLAWAVRRQ
jgi:hypothetical protein